MVYCINLLTQKRAWGMSIIQTGSSCNQWIAIMVSLKIILFHEVISYWNKMVHMFSIFRTPLKESSFTTIAPGHSLEHDIDLTSNASSAKIDSIVHWTNFSKNHASKLKLCTRNYDLCADNDGITFGTICRTLTELYVIFCPARLHLIGYTILTGTLFVSRCNMAYWDSSAVSEVNNC